MARSSCRLLQLLNLITTQTHGAFSRLYLAQQGIMAQDGRARRKEERSCATCDQNCFRLASPVYRESVANLEFCAIVTSRCSQQSPVESLAGSLNGMTKSMSFVSHCQQWSTARVVAAREAGRRSAQESSAWLNPDKLTHQSSTIDQLSQSPAQSRLC